MSEEKLFVYLMKDFRSGYYKIGYSNNPANREKTLQSEQPLIQMCDFWEAQKSDEKELHKMFSKLRVRGEWFALQQQEISQVYRYFHDKTHVNKDDINRLGWEVDRLEKELYTAQGKIERLERELDYYKIKPPPEKPKILDEVVGHLQKAVPQIRLLPTLPPRPEMPNLAGPGMNEYFQFRAENEQKRLEVVANGGISMYHEKSDETQYTDEVPF